VRVILLLPLIVFMHIQVYCAVVQTIYEKMPDKWSYQAQV